MKDNEKAADAMRDLIQMATDSGELKRENERLRAQVLKLRKAELEAHGVNAAGFGDALEHVFTSANIDPMSATATQLLQAKNPALFTPERQTEAAPDDGIIESQLLKSNSINHSYIKTLPLEQREHAKQRARDAQLAHLKENAAARRF